MGNAGHQGKLSVDVVMLVSVQLGPVEVLLDTAHVAVGHQLIFGGNLGLEVLLVLVLLIAPEFLLLFVQHRVHAGVSLGHEVVLVATVILKGFLDSHLLL